MPLLTDRIDCIVVGYNDLDYGTLLAGAEATKDYSPMFSEMKRSSARFQGRRLPYMELLNASIETATGFNPKLHVCRLPALGVSYLTSYLRRRGLVAEGIQFYNGELDRFRDLLQTRPRSVAITTTFYVDAAPIVEIIAMVRQHSPDTIVILGGPHIFNICEALTPQTQEFILGQIPAEVFVHDSQGETALGAVVAELRQPSPDLSPIPNLLFKLPGQPKFTHTPRVIEDNDMDSNVIDWSHFDDSVYTPTVQLRTARSCAFSCAFCRYPVVGGALALNTVDIVERELRKLKAKGVEQVIFIDDTFNVPLNRFKELCRMMIRNKFDFQWFSYFRCSNSDQEAFDVMAEAGCKGTFLGIESGDQTVLNNMNKHAKIDKYRVGIENLRKRGITTHASFIVGYPGETEATVQNTIDFVNSTGPTFFNAGVFYYDVKAPVANRGAEFGLKGGGFNWKHNTMDWKTAVEQSERFYREVHASTIFPTYMFDFWSIPYLIGRGFSVKQIEDFAKLAKPMLLAGMDAPSQDNPELDRRLVEHFQNGGLPEKIRTAAAAAQPA